MVRPVAQRYTSDAEAYERLFAPFLLGLSSAFVARLPLGDASRVLDLGCGVGTLLPRLSSAAPNAVVCGVDLTHAMVLRASPAYGRAVMDAESLGFHDASFDAVVSVFMLQHVPDAGRAFGEVRRVLRDGGVLATVTWHGPVAGYPALRLLSEILDEHGAAPVEALKRTDEVENPETLTSLLSSAGLAVVEQRVRSVPYKMSKESFLERMTGLGLARRRFETLAEPDAFVVAAAERLGSLPGSAFEEPLEIIETLARA